jgi:two-component system, OmpR family, KDP operon response regulator KdpE
MTKKDKILVIDDEPQIRKLLKLSLESYDYDVILAETGLSGIQLAASQNPSLIILDLNLPDENGKNVLKQIREWSSVQIIILSVKSSEVDKIELLDCGANDYVTKPFHIGELLARIRVALRNESAVSKDPEFCFDDIVINFSSRKVLKADIEINLTSTEYQLLKLFIQNKDKVLTHRQILESIWGRTFSEEVQYIRVFIAQLRKKIEKDPIKPHYIKTMSGVGYIFSI